MQAIMLAAGKGARLGKYTKDNTKCMLEVNGKTLLERAIDALLEANIHKLILVLGYKKDNVKEFIKEKKLYEKIEIEYIDNDIYDKTNNIYSLYLAKDKLAEDDTILLESDLIYESRLIKELVNCNNKNVAAVAPYEYWMDGTVVTINENNLITNFIEKQDFNYEMVNQYYKTINVYKFSKNFSEKYYIPFLEAYIKCFGENVYYELVLSVLSNLKNSELYAMIPTNLIWYEIDDCQDLDMAQILFSEPEKRKKLINSRFGGYWRFNKTIDYCYLVNPYFPTKQYIDKIKYFTDTLVREYPSSLKVQSNIASRMFENLSEENIILGNGAAELINVLKYVVKGKIGLPIPSFNEYVRCFPNNTIIEIPTYETNYRLDINVLINTLKEVDALVIISPDNPSGSALEYNEVIKLLDEAKKQDKLIIFDESFGDFKKENFTLINDDILKEYPNLIVIKSISKSYGVAGLRIGILGTANEEYKTIIKENLPVWNINSFAEFFLQSITIYKKDYLKACEKIKQVRDEFYEELKTIKEIEVYPSESNYFLIKLNKINSEDLSLKMLNKYNILIKTLNNKKGFDNQNYIRVAVKTKEENQYFVECLNKYIKESK